MLRSGGSGWHWRGMVSLAPKWGLPAAEHCCFCTPHAVSAFQTYLSSSFRMRIYFQGKTNTCTYRIHYEKCIRLIVGWDPLPGFCAQVCKGETPTWLREVSNCPWSIHTLRSSWLLFTIQAMNVSVFPKQSAPPGFPRMKPWAKRWEHPFHTDMVPSFRNQGSSFFPPEHN